MLRALSSRPAHLRLLFRSFAAHATPAFRLPPSADDVALIDFFDRPVARSWLRTYAAGTTGLFLQPALTRPAAFRDVADAALNRAQLLVERIIRAPHSRDELRKVVKNLDRLSNILCGVIDLAELVRHAHPDPRWIDAANDAYAHLYEYMNVLNTHVGLYQVLKLVFQDSEIWAQLSDEARETALIFWRDFEKSGIDLPPHLRTRFVELSSEIFTLGRDFVNNASQPRPSVSLPVEPLRELRSLGSLRKMRFLGTANTISIQPGSNEARMIMANVSDDATRRALFVASHSSSREDVEVLEALLRTRASLASLVGKPSFAHMALDDKMTKTPENVMLFLSTQLGLSRPRALADVCELAKLKQRHLGRQDLPPIQPWDRDYFLPHVASPALPGEAWHEDVRKLEVIDENEGLVGWIYADLFTRPGKATGAAHYTVRCSRRADDDDADGDFDLASGAQPVNDPRALHVPAHAVRGKPGLYQLPIVVLLCDFPSPTNDRGASTLDWSDVSTTVHEMGHAVHSMIGRTDYQNVGGTRCATDFVELPSLLMEHFFLSSPDVLSLFQPKSDTSTSVVIPSHNSQDDSAVGAALDSHAQLLLATLDQLYHSPLAGEVNFNTTTIYSNLQDTHGALPSIPGTSWQTRFGHLYGYGATYYSYIFDRALARAVWERVFAKAPLERQAGERFRQDVLRHGGAKDPWKMLASVLDIPELEAGDACAMEMVGQWRAEDNGSGRTVH
ncbi:mitochondrial intermediate peptidase [Auriculariales sp. MPI-PUGE-AT-0066]|nr:mitochondrial intermediate peptidase [Auriculariales sp. MPI-PUGE-AT-0066]